MEMDFRIEHCSPLREHTSSASYVELCVNVDEMPEWNGISTIRFALTEQDVYDLLCQLEQAQDNEYALQLM